MGVGILWQFLPQTQQVLVQNAFYKTDFSPFKISIDASIWIVSLTQKAPKLFSSESDIFAFVVRTLFFKCSRIYSLNVFGVLVVDESVKLRFQNIFTQLVVICDLFGFVCYSTKCNAEAECAFLNNVDVVDAVLTDDVDAFLFGAKTIVRNWFDSDTSRKDSTFKYEISDIRRITSLSRCSLVLIALLSGSDDAPGIKKLGIESAMRLARDASNNGRNDYISADTIIHSLISVNPELAFFPLFNLLSQLVDNDLYLLKKKRGSSIPKVSDSRKDDLSILCNDLILKWQKLATNYMLPDTFAKNNPQIIAEIEKKAGVAISHCVDHSQVAVWVKKCFGLNFYSKRYLKTFGRTIGTSVRMKLLFKRAYQNNDSSQNHVNVGFFGEYKKLPEISRLTRERLWNNERQLRVEWTSEFSNNSNNLALWGSFGNADDSNLQNEVEVITIDDEETKSSIIESSSESICRDWVMHYLIVKAAPAEYKDYVNKRVKISSRSKSIPNTPESNLRSNVRQWHSESKNSDKLNSKHKYRANLSTPTSCYKPY